MRSLLFISQISELSGYKAACRESDVAFDGSAQTNRARAYKLPQKHVGEIYPPIRAYYRLDKSECPIPFFWAYARP